MSGGLDDRADREQIRERLDESLIVEAAAGTGKTTLLVERLVAVLAGGLTTIDRIVGVTFTNKAAGELKLRLRQELDRARFAADDPRVRQNLAEALEHLEDAHVGTIHSFCAQILRERPVEAAIDPDFVEIDDEEAEQLYDRAFRGWVERTLDAMQPGLRRALSRLVTVPAFDQQPPLTRLRDAGRWLSEWRDYPAPWRRRDFARQERIDALVQEVAEVAALYRECADGKDPLRQALAPADALETWIRRSEQDAERDHDVLEARLIETLRGLRRQSRRKGRGSWPVEGLSRAEVARRRDALIEALEDFQTEADADLAALLREELAEVTDEYERAKREGGTLDFLDLLLRARDLVVGSAEVRAWMQERFTHVFVDEFQDTDPLQVELLMLLVADDPAVDDWRQIVPGVGKLFLVGDPKQSIYRFRRADVILYRDVREQLVAAGVRCLHLTRSYRSVARLQEPVNQAFAEHMTGDARSGQPDYVALRPHRETPSEQPHLVALPIPDPYGHWGAKYAKYKVQQGEPAVVAGFLHWLFEESGWTVEDPDGGGRVAIRPSHVALLFRRFLSWGEDVTRPYLAELEARGIPHLLAGGRSFHQREEVETVRAALNAIEWPDDELSVFATLRGGLFAIDDGTLMRFRTEVHRLHPFRKIPDDVAEELTPVVDALSLLARLHRRRNAVPIAQTIAELLEATRAHPGFALRPAGNQVLANVQRVADLARSFELRGGLSFRGFVQRLGEEAERRGSAESPVLEEGAEGVRIMTVHGAKGLEFPVVLLADITANLTHANPRTHIDSSRRLCATRVLGCAPWELVDNADVERERDAAEGVRLAYVAATRARDLLVVPTVGDGPWDGGWTDPLRKALYPAWDARRESRPALGCPDFGERSVLSRPERAHGDVEVSVRPGLHESEAGTEVVWWDPALLDLSVPRNFGLRQERLLSPDAPAYTLDRARGRYEDWKRSRAESLATGGVPEFRVIVISETEEDPGIDADVRVVDARASGDRPGGRRFGTLVHTVLRDLGPGSEREAIERLAHLQGRTLGATEAEVEAAADAVQRALAHPLLRRSAAAARSYRELPLTFRRDERTVVEGVLDLLFEEEDGGWTIVDFKTDGAETSLLERYANQAAWYVLAVNELLGAPARAVLLSV